MGLHRLRWIMVLAVAVNLSFAAAQEEASCFASMTSEPLPGDEFSWLEGETSTIAATTVQKCGLQYPDCFENTHVNYITDPGFTVSDTSVCREVMRYRIPVQQTWPPSSSSVNSADDVQCSPNAGGDPCSCQLPAPTGAANITFDLTLDTEDCCTQCSCIGDPHCTSFSGAQDSWVVCNARNPNTCDVSARDCQDRTWNGQKCVFRQDKRGNSGCMPNPALASQPEMVMYSKIYANASQGQNQMRIVLRLGSLGNIVCVTSSFGPLNGPGRGRQFRVCTPQYGGQGVANDASNGDWVGLSEMNQLYAETRVRANIQIRNPGGLAERLELWIDDKDAGNSITRGGFCETGVIEENEGQPTFHCSPSDEFIFRRMCWNNLLQRRIQCTQRNTAPGVVISGKRFWCGDAFPGNAEECMARPWWKSICTKLCGADPSCLLSCELKITEVPNEVVTELKRRPSPAPGGHAAPTAPPTPCPSAQATHPYVTSNGATRGPLVNGLPRPDSYLFVQRRNEGGWTSPLLWFTKDHLKCGQRITVTDASSRLMDPGATYRLLQCQRSSDRCGEKVVKVTTRVSYRAPANLASGTGSAPLRVLFDSGRLSCARAKYPQCPPDFRCCVWTTLPLWTQCMIKAYGIQFASSYPTCTYASMSSGMQG